MIDTYVMFCIYMILFSYIYFLYRLFKSSRKRVEKIIVFLFSLFIIGGVSQIKFCTGGNASFCNKKNVDCAAIIPPTCENMYTKLKTHFLKEKKDSEFIYYDKAFNR